MILQIFDLLLQLLQLARLSLVLQTPGVDLLPRRLQLLRRLRRSGVLLQLLLLLSQQLLLLPQLLLLLLQLLLLLLQLLLLLLQLLLLLFHLLRLLLQLPLGFGELFFRLLQLRVRFRRAGLNAHCVALTIGALALYAHLREQGLALLLDRRRIPLNQRFLLVGREQLPLQVLGLSLQLANAIVLLPQLEPQVLR